MPPTIATPHPSIQLPLRVLAVVLVLVFAVELGIMFLLPRLTRATGLAADGVGVALSDALLLTTVLCPALWFVVVRPLRDLSEQRRRLLARVIQVQEDERARISRDLHDEFGQLLTTVLVGLRTVQDAPDLQHARERALALRDVTAAGIESVKRIAQGLRATILADLGLAPAIERLCDEAAATHGLDASVSIGLPPGARFPEPVELCIYRFVQEGLTNVARHARASEAAVSLRLDADALEVEVRDNGAGLAPRPHDAPAGMGLQGMRERVLLLGGTMTLHSAPGAGCTLSARLPIAEPA